MTSNQNPYMPEMATVTRIIEETPNIRSFQIVLNDKEKMKAFKFQPGQVGQLSVFGVGESTFVINTPPTRMDYLQFSVMKAGEVTSALHNIYEGDQVGVRGPLGNYFPYEKMKGKNILFIGGGIGMAPLRTLILYMLDNRADYKDITIIYGARTPADLCFKEDVKEWESRKDVNLILTVDAQFPGWEKRVGFVPTVLKEVAPKPDNTVAITCGPPIMIKFVLEGLAELKFPDDQIITTLEKRMKCGIGLCGRCNIGHKYVCKDGPVFTLKELKELPDEA
jgi:sulfhydrogenase subunit gamma (sulfur reductase)